MSEATYLLQPSCTIEDGVALAAVNAPAFWTQPWWRIMWGDRTLASMTTALATRVPGNLLIDMHIRRHQKVVHRESGQVVGYARWILSEGLEGEWAEARTPDVDAEVRRLAEERSAKADMRIQVDTSALDPTVAQLMENWTPKELDYLAVHPDHHRKGIASLLIRSGIEQAQRLDVPIFALATSLDSLKLYPKLGFDVLQTTSQTMDQWEKGATYDVAAVIHLPYDSSEGEATAD